MIAGRVYERLKIRGRTVVLRAMDWDDTDKLLAFVNGLVDDKQRGRSPDVFSGFERKVSRPEEADWVASQMVRIENGDLVSVVAETNRRIAANGGITRGHYDETRFHGELGLTVMAAHRGMGIGREVVRILLREARRLGLKNVEVEFLSTNQAAVHTYQRAGFKEVGRIPGKVHRNGKFLDSLIMARDV